MNLHLQPDWQRVLRQYVEVRRGGEFIRAGIVEDVMPDNSVIWISTAGAQPRKLYERDDGYTVFARYHWDPAHVLDCKQTDAGESESLSGLPKRCAAEDFQRYPWEQSSSC